MCIRDSLHGHRPDVWWSNHHLFLFITEVLLDVVPVLHVLICSLDWNSESTLRFERLLVTGCDLDVPMLPPLNLDQSGLELVTQGVVARRTEEHLVDTGATLDWVGPHVGRVREDLFWIFALRVAARLLLLIHAVITDGQRRI